MKDACKSRELFAVKWEMAEKFWEEQFNKALHQVRDAGSWRWPWFENPDKDGNPIFTAISDDRRLAVRILQFERTDSDDLDLDWWTDTVGEDAAIQELVISCIPSQENFEKISDLLVQWIRSASIPVNQ